MAKGPKRNKPRSGPKRFSSFPARLPNEKEKVSPELLDAIDTIGENLDKQEWVYDPFPRQRAKGGVRWTIDRGRSETVWVAHARFMGDFTYKGLNSSFKRIEKVLRKKQLVYMAFLYNELDDNGEVVHEGWASVPGGIQVWASAIKAAQTMTSPNVKGSFGRRYRHSVIREIHIQIASHARETFLDAED